MPIVIHADICHPFVQYALSDAVKLAEGHAALCLEPAPQTLEEVREVIQGMVKNADHLWLTGNAALDVLDAAIDGRDLQSDARYC